MVRWTVKDPFVLVDIYKNKNGTCSWNKKNILMSKSIETHEAEHWSQYQTRLWDRRRSDCPFRLILWLITFSFANMCFLAHKTDQHITKMRLWPAAYLALRSQWLQTWSRSPRRPPTRSSCLVQFLRALQPAYWERPAHTANTRSVQLIRVLHLAFLDWNLTYNDCTYVWWNISVLAGLTDI